MTSQITNNHSAHHHDHDTEATSKVVFGFWVYIMSDCILFSCFFASYAVLHANVFGGPGPKELFDLNYVMIETFLLLTSSFTYGLATLAMTKENKAQVMLWLFFTFLLGLGFIGMEINEFHHLIIEGNGPSRSAFLSSFFGLVGLHGLHVTCGLIWMALLMVQVYKRGLTAIVKRKLSCLSLFWHFLDIIWIFVFTVVYLMGVM
ncbi:MAG TPA: cytochrome o ubiquinol oxidase subunit III [Neisseriales bacterium]|jgi:cytochrome o ubiquinol oxidase subunit 3|nr:cytochrome o ubiquinol oxidase subunit III [Neisseriales bacterium]